ncbi:hypothetical protein [Thermoactinomyces sp. DSM 45892]|uniref:hypothetical protein n=1 Tax=Thermoactinomyces sp. DSM 45892 TaxID=1882753 RepID=UPI00089918E5|nr:hypothetical protein [Thermoactinomyces sp. DSM 45892]SDZ20668.1 hypothetical protein SAMN05444416_11628 [Thermoactinomyces sp. DSM 45892]
MSFFSGPMLWIGLGVIIIIMIAGISIIIGKKRAKELEELNQFFPEDEQYETSSISVEKVRRSTRRRERKRQQAQYLSETDQVDEDQEEFVNKEHVASSLIEHKLVRKKEVEKAEFGQPSSWRSRREQHAQSTLLEDDKKENEQNDHHEDEFLTHTQPFARRRFARKEPTASHSVVKPESELEQDQDVSSSTHSKAITRRLYKQNLLGVDSTEETDSSMQAPVVEAMETVKMAPVTPDRRQSKEFQEPSATREKVNPEGFQDRKRVNKKKRLY